MILVQAIIPPPPNRYQLCFPLTLLWVEQSMRVSRWELVRKIKFYWITSPFISFTFQIPTFFNFILPALKKLVDCGLSIDYLPSCCHVKFLCANAAPQKKVECNVADCAQRRKVKLKTETKLVSSFKSFSDLIIFTKVCDEPRKGEVRFTENSGDSRDRLGSDTGMGWLGSPGKRRGGGKTTRNVHMKTRASLLSSWLETSVCHGNPRPHIHSQG